MVEAAVDLPAPKRTRYDVEDVEDVSVVGEAPFGGGLSSRLASLLNLGRPRRTPFQSLPSVTDFLDPTNLTPMVVDPEYPPNISEGYYRTAVDDNSVKFSYLFVLMAEPEFPSSLRLSWEAVYPAVLLTNSSRVKRRCAVCRRTFGEYRSLHGRMYSFLKRNRIRGTKMRMAPLWPIPSCFVERRKKAIEDFINNLVTDFRVFNVPLFHAFFYTNLPAEDLFADGLGIQTAKRLVISAELQDYERDILPEMLGDREIHHFARQRGKMLENDIDVAFEAQVDDEVEAYEEPQAYNVAYTAASPVAAEAAATVGSLGSLGSLGSGEERPGSCVPCTVEEEDERDLTLTATDAASVPITITIDRAQELAHDCSVARSFINLGNEERVSRTPDGKILVYDPNPIVTGSCPAESQCRVHMHRRRMSRKKLHHHPRSGGGVSRSAAIRTSSTVADIHYSGSSASSSAAVISSSFPGLRYGSALAACSTSSSMSPTSPHGHMFNVGSPDSSDLMPPLEEEENRAFANDD